MKDSGTGGINVHSKTSRATKRLAAAGTDVALITDDDCIYYLTGYYDYLHMEFGRPTILVVPKDGKSLLITPTIDLVMAQAVAQVDFIAAWNDGAGEEWRAELPAAVQGAARIAIQPDHIQPIVQRYLEELVGTKTFGNVTSILADMRMIKSPEELQLARHAGQVASAMMTAGRGAIGDGVPEYEVALATAQAGTRKAAELLAAHYSDAEMSPNTHFLQIMASGKDIIKTHHRASTRIMKHGEPVFFVLLRDDEFSPF